MEFFVELPEPDRAPVRDRLITRCELARAPSRRRPWTTLTIDDLSLAHVVSDVCGARLCVATICA